MNEFKQNKNKEKLALLEINERGRSNEAIELISKIDA
jgi:hypothetical protein